jgi:hypothetical protein
MDPFIICAIIAVLSALVTIIGAKLYLNDNLSDRIRVNGGATAFMSVIVLLACCVFAMTYGQ